MYLDDEDPSEPSLEDASLALSPVESMTTSNKGLAVFGLTVFGLTVFGLMSVFVGQVRIGFGGGGAVPVLLDALFRADPRYPSLPGVAPCRKSRILPEVTPGRLLVSGGGNGGGGGGGFGSGGGLHVFLRSDDLPCVPDGDDLLERLLSELILVSGRYLFSAGLERGPGMQIHAKVIGERLAEAKMACG